VISVCLQALQIEKEQSVLAAGVIEDREAAAVEGAEFILYRRVEAFVTL
jgi:hypothetical protein